MFGGLFGWARSPEGSDAEVEQTIGAPPPADPLTKPLATSAEQRFGDQEEIGRGGMARVYRVRDGNLGREVAMKVLDLERAQDPAEAGAFVSEALTTAQLDHPNIVPVHDVGVDSHGRTYLVMRLVAGETLRQLLRAEGDTRSFGERLHEFLLVMLKVCDAVSFAHSRGVIHCDLKPQNVMVGAHGEVYVVDWGGARKRDSGSAGRQAAITPVASAPEAGTSAGSSVVFGTPAYMAPEQARAVEAEIGERTDVFGLGTLLYFFLTNRAPFMAASVAEATALALECRYKDPNELAPAPLPPALHEIIATAMARDPADRYGSAADLKRALEKFLRGGGGFVTTRFTAGAKIIAEGDVADAAYIITRGTCRVHKTIDGEQRVLRTMGPGEVFGETALILSAPRTATVEAVDDVTVQVVTPDELDKAFEFHPWLKRIVRTITERFRELDARQ
ncbi:protein kinase [Planctomycetota bacterium]